MTGLALEIAQPVQGDDAERNSRESSETEGSHGGPTESLVHADERAARSTMANTAPSSKSPQRCLCTAGGLAVTTMVVMNRLVRTIGRSDSRCIKSN